MIRKAAFNIKILLGIILITGFFLQVFAYKYPYEWDDASRDYLVANHILTYSEFPMTGYTGAVAEIKNSPVYFYFLAFLLAVKNDPYFLGVVNILLRTATAFIIFILARRFYGKHEGLLAAAFFSFSPISLYQSIHILQPWIMQFFINLSFLFLYIAYKNTTYYLLIISTFFFITAAVFHNSAFALVPLFAVVSFLVLKKQKSSFTDYAGYLIFFLSLIFLYYLPVIVYHLNNSGSTIGLFNKIYLLTVPESIMLLLHNSFYLINTTFLYPVNDFFSAYIFPLLIICLIVLHFKIEDKKHKKLALIIIYSAATFILLTSITNLKSFTGNYFYYFTPVLGLVMIITARSITLLYRKYKAVDYVFVLSAFGYAALCLSYYVSYHSMTNNRPPYHPGADAIKNEILLIKNAKGYEDFNFFQIISMVESHGWKYSASFWVPLEKELKTKFTKLSDRDIRSFEEIQNEKEAYVFLVCPNAGLYRKKANQCADQFLLSKNDLRFEKDVFTNERYSIYLLVKINGEAIIASRL